MMRPHTPQDPADPFLTTREAALLLGVSLRSVQLWVEAGKLHAGRTPGGHRRIRTSAVQALAAEQGLGEPINPLQAQLDAALADGRRLHDAYLGAERELESARAQVTRLQSALDDAKAGESVAQMAAPLQPLTDEQIGGLMMRHHRRLELARAIERAHGIGAEGSNEPPACRNCGGVGANCLGKMGCRSQQLVVPAQITRAAP